MTQLLAEQAGRQTRQSEEIHMLKSELDLMRTQIAERDRELQTVVSDAALKEEEVQALRMQIALRDAQMARITGSLGWRLLSYYGPIKYGFVKPLWRFFKSFGTNHPATKAAPDLETAPTANGIQQPAAKVMRPSGTTAFPVLEVTERPPVEPHRARVDIIICVHSPLGVVKRCLKTLVQCTGMPYSFILVDDGSDEETRKYLVDFALAQGAVLLRNDLAAGFALAADKGLRHSDADYVVILNSDVEVTAGWLERMVACAESDARIGLVGPPTNYDPRQAISDVLKHDEWPVSSLPEGASPADIAAALRETSSRLYPRLPFLSGFCLMIKRAVINEVGYFDEASFGEWFMGEMDYRLRADKVGWQLALADVYVSNSRS